MNPVAFSVFGVDIYWYGILIGLAVIIGTIIGLQSAKRKGIDEETILDLVLVTVPIAILGARLYYVAFEWDRYGGDIRKILSFRDGGLAIHGGIIFAVISGYLFARYNDIEFWTLADIAAPSMILGQSIGRWGNYINQEAHGGPTDLPWGIMIDGVKVHPTFLYESIWNFLVFLFLFWYDRNKEHPEGEVFLMYLALYSLARVFIEGLRTDSLMLGNIRVAQLVSIVLIIISSIGIYIKRKNFKKEKSL